MVNLYLACVIVYDLLFMFYINLLKGRKTTGMARLRNEYKGNMFFASRDRELP